jgi:hypothetical protein
MIELLEKEALFLGHYHKWFTLLEKEALFFV